ncbi:Nucleolar GTP-binding protein 2 [Armadillidium vulgare]|nr:Nucleolar GTP-binding protein 2 [Armadillidium vulgare]
MARKTKDKKFSSRKGFHKGNKPSALKGVHKGNNSGKTPAREGFRKGNNSSNPDRKSEDVKLNGAPYMRSKSTVSRVEPSQRWFGNVQVIGQKALQNFQEEMKKVLNDPYQVVMRQTKLPISLLNEKAKHMRVHILDTEPFESVFGSKKTRKKPNLKVTDIKEYAAKAQEANEKYDPSKDDSLVKDVPDNHDLPPVWYMKAGQSKRIWSELYKVIDSSDVVLQVLDARDPMGTRSSLVEKYLKTEKPHKHLVFVLNKVDLVPVWVTQKWVACLSQEYPSLAFHSSLTNSFGKGALISLLRQFAKLHNDKKQISVGLIGYPNVGKSSIINTLRAKKVCNVAPIAGETKVWQYVTLMRRIYLIDCPGIVPPSHETPEDMVLKGAVRTEYLSTPTDFIPEVLRRVKHDYLRRTYKIENWTTPDDFLEQVCRRTGKLLRGGEPDKNTVAKMMLNDWQRGKIPYFVPPPGHDSTDFSRLKWSENQKTIKHIEEEEKIEEEELKKVGRLVKQDDDDDDDNTRPKVSQNFRNIHLTVEYDREDDKPLIEDLNFDGNDTEEDDDETETSIVKENEVLQQQKEETVDTNQREDTVTTELNGKSEKNSQAEEYEKVEGESMETHKELEMSLENDQGEPIEAIESDNENEEEIVGEELLSSDDDLKEDLSSSGAFSVRKIRRKKKLTPEEKRLLKQQPPPLTCKERRRIERAQKRKKIGSNFYEVTNVKNRNRERKCEKFQFVNKRKK